MPTQSTLLTSRLILGPLTHVDAPLIQNVAGVGEIADTMISIPHPYPDGEAEQYIRRQIAEFQAGHSVSFVIERKSKKEFCGIIARSRYRTRTFPGRIEFLVSGWGLGARVYE